MLSRFSLVLLLALLIGCSTSDRPHQTGSLNGFGGGFDSMEDGGGGGGGLLSTFGPVAGPQSLADWTQTAIAEWGPVQQTHFVQNGTSQVVGVNQLETGDPFTATYQLPSGTLVTSNRPLSELIDEIPDNSHPPIVPWSGNADWDPMDIYQGEIVIGFVASATEQQISQFLLANNLEVIMSFFTSSPTGNDAAIFHLRYDQGQFASFSLAYSHFNALSLVDYVEPSIATPVMPAYTDPQGSGSEEPNDLYYSPFPPPYYGGNEYPKHLNIADSALVPFGPESVSGGQWFSRSVVAIIDDGVFRNHEDLWVVLSHQPPETSLGQLGKTSWVGVNIEHETIWVGYQSSPYNWYGEPNPAYLDAERANGLHSHGTRIAGLISAGTNNTVGTYGCAPTVLTLPIRLDQQWYPAKQKYAFSAASTRVAGKALYDFF